MFKLVVLAVIVSAAKAGIISGGLGHGYVSAPLAVAHAPLAVAHAPVAVAHATSYQNSNQLSLHPSPVVVAHAAPVAVAHALPVAAGYGLGHGLLH